MNGFLSGLGMGMVAGACVGMAFAGMMSEGDKRRLRKSAKKAVDTILPPCM